MASDPGEVGEGARAMKKYQGALLCLVSAFGLLAAACVPPTTPGPTNLAPVAVLSADPTSGDVPLDVEFSSAGSTDSDGTIAAYEWNFGDGSAVVTTAEPSPKFHS